MASPYYEHRLEALRERGFSTIKDYRNYLAHQKGFKSCYYYLQNLAIKRQNRQEYQESALLIKSRIEEMNKNYAWLAGQLKMSRQTAMMYCQGKSKPTGEQLEKLYSILGVEREWVKEYVAAKAKNKRLTLEKWKLSRLIKAGLKEKGKSRKWLAGQIGKTIYSVSYYAQGRVLPPPETLERIFQELEINETGMLEQLVS